MDNYEYFCDFFELNHQASNEAKQRDYEARLNRFKTLFPEYVLNNEQIQHSITAASGLYETVNHTTIPTPVSQGRNGSIFKDPYNFGDQ